LGAAQDAYAGATGAGNPTIALGYAVAYPLGVVGIIVSMLLLRAVFRISLPEENERLAAAEAENKNAVCLLSLEVKNPALFGKDIKTILGLTNRQIVISRVCHADGSIELASSKSILREDDRTLVITTPRDRRAVSDFIGRVVEMSNEQWNKLSSDFVSRRILVTRSGVPGKTLAQLNLRNRFGVNITRVNRAGIDLIARPALALQMGDRVMVVGTPEAIGGVEKVLGNQLKRLREPNLIPIFIGIFLGVLAGCIPITLPGIPQPLKLGLAGGPLVVAILISVFGPKLKIVTYATMSANLMLREVGISLFLACVGLEAGEHFVETILHGGWQWVGWGVIITVVPLLVFGAIGKRWCKLNFFSLMGLLAGSTTDPPALSYAVATAGNDMPSISYASVYPLTMFLRVLSAQLLILLFV
jgi:putative transport protein